MTSYSKIRKPIYGHRGTRERGGVRSRWWAQFNLYQLAKRTSALMTVGQFPTTDTLVDPDHIREISIQTLPLQPR